MKRLSWTHAFQEKAHDGAVRQADLIYLDDIFYDLWAPGRYIILVWAPRNKGIDLLVIPHYTIGETIADPKYTVRQNRQKHIYPILQKIVSGSKMVSVDRMRSTDEMRNVQPHHIENQYVLTDKHGHTHHVFYAKVNIHRGKGIPIYLGLQAAELADFGIAGNC